MSITGNWDRRRVSRRKFLAMSGMGAAALSLGAHGLWTPRRGLAQFAEGYPFRLGVASGDPSSGGVVLWTRLAPDPLNDGGMGDSNDVTVDWEVAEDEGFVNVVQQSLDDSKATYKAPALAEKKYAHSVHLEVTGLKPATTYYYRFKKDNHTSPTGRTKTAPAAGSPVPGMNIAVFACQHWEGGRYPVYRHVADRQDLDFVVHLGDYIYEGAPSNGNVIRRHSSVEDSSWGCNTLADFRNRHAQYKTDPELQDAHAAHPWVVTWDDHEVENDYAGTKSWYRQSDFLARRAAAYQAYYEHMPISPSRVKLDEQGKVQNMDIYRQVAYGDLAQLLVLDTRQYRTEQPCPDQGSLIETTCKDRTQDPIMRKRKPYRRHTMLGAGGSATERNPWLKDPQESWLKGNLTSSGYTWNVLAQQVPMFQYDHKSWYGNFYSESWDSYAATRQRILKHLAEKKVPNPVVLTGDMHSSWAADLETNFSDKTHSDVIGAEFIGTSVSSGLGSDWDKIYRDAMPSNRHVKYYNGRTGGYLLCRVTPRYWQADYYLASSLGSPDSPVSRVASWYAQAGAPGAKQGTPLDQA